MEGEFSSVSTPELVSEITTLAGHLNAGNARFLALIAELDRRRGWAEAGVKSCAHWLNWQCGIGLGAAREKVRVARALETLPRLAAAMAEGRVSYFKAREITRVATPANEDYLLNIALCGTASHVEDVVRGYRRALDAAELTREAVQQRDQHLWFHTEPDGSLVDPRPGTGGGRRAVQAGSRSGPRPPADPGKRSGRNVFGARRTAPLPEAPGRGAGHAGRELPRDRSAGSLRIGPPADRGPCRCRDPQALPCRAAASWSTVPSIASETARRLACDCSVVRIVEDAKGEPLDVGSRTRTIPPGIRRALQARDKGCRFPGCTFKRYVDGHHVKHWANGGETQLSNLVTLCRFHHRLVHEGQVVVQTLDDGAFRFVRPDG